MLSDLWFFVKVFIVSSIITAALWWNVFFGSVEDYNPCNEPVKEEVKPNDSTASSGYYETMPIIKDVTTSKKWI